MTVIKVPKPPKSAFNPNRPISALLRNQILHLQEAELRFPARHQTNIYINKIKTEGEAAKYIQQVTAILHPGGRRVGFDIAAMGEPKTPGKSSVKRKTKSKGKAKSPRNGEK